MSFKSQKQLLEHLIGGGKIKNGDEYSGYFLRIDNDGDLIWSDGEISHESFVDYKSWQIYEEPKPKRKVTLYRYTYRDHEIQQSWWTEMTFEKYKHGLDRKLLQTETKEIEIEEPST